MKLAVTKQFRTVTLLVLVCSGYAGAAEGSAKILGNGIVEVLESGSVQGFSDGVAQEVDNGSTQEISDAIFEDFSDDSAQASGAGSAKDFIDGIVDNFSSGSIHASSALTFNNGTRKHLPVEMASDKKESTALVVRGIDIVVFLRGLMSEFQLWVEDWWSLISTNINSPEEIWRQRKLFSDSVDLYPVGRRKREASNTKCKRGTTAAAVCGIAPPSGAAEGGRLPRSKRIVNGTTSRQGQWPWMVSIYIKDRFEKVTNSCGGVLIDRDIVMSASHCFTDPEIKWSVNVDQLYVRVGSNRNPFDQYVDPDEGAIVSKVRKANFHPDFNSRTFDNDVALFLLDDPEVYRRNFMPICLPSSNGRNHVGETGVVAGWGLLKFSGSLPPLLQETDVQILSGKQCDDWYRNRTSLVNTTKAFLCAGYRDGFKDACTGDSGGPLMIQDERGRWTTCGIVSHGYKCAQLQSPGVYVNVTSYRPWIDETKRQLYKLRQKDL